MPGDVSGLATPHALDAAYLRDLLARCTDLAELKIALYVALAAAERSHPLVPIEELLTPDVIRSVAGPTSPESGEVRAQRTVERALVNGWLLRLSVSEADATRVYLLPSTDMYRGYVERIRAGDVGVEEALGLPPEGEASVFRPNVFAQYEQFIGPLTPLIAEQLRDAERSYPRQWIEEAIREAVDYNKPNWRYVQTILSNWEKSGAPDGVTRRHS